MTDDEMEHTDLSREMTDARRAMRAKVLSLQDRELKDLYYKSLMFSEHEAARLAVQRVLARANMSNKAEA